MNILLTGGAGFIGSHIGDALIADGHTVIAVDNLSTGDRENVNNEAYFYECDIRDRDAIDRVFRENRIDLVSHHAAQTDVRRSVARPGYDASVNILGLLNLMDCCLQHNVARVMFASTGGAIYGEQDYFPADEKHPTRPISPYGVSKLSSEAYLYYYSAVHGVDVAILRYANVYGPRQNPHGEAGVAAIFTNNILAGKECVINGDGSQTRDYVFVGDVVAANVAALPNRGYNVFNIGTGEETDVNRMYDLLRMYAGSDTVPLHGPGKSGEQKRSVLDASKIGRVYGWKPTETVESGLSKTVSWFMSRAAMAVPTV
ncbi:MAG: NAD-dependent epimerase/dehydratase family protein [Ignavibacteria bacterium]|nr:NAD-dependent epimerase/dehydratase family protein [Ignavibacteria bacterium]